MNAVEPGTRWETGIALRAALAVAGVLFFYTGLDNYGYHQAWLPTPLLIVLAFVGAAAALVVARARAPMAFLRSPLLVWILFYFALTTAWAIWMRNSPRVMQSLFDRLRSVGFLVAFAILFDDPRARRLAALAVAGAALFAALLNIAELFGLVEFAKQEDIRVMGRSAGLYINPNASGLAIVLGLAVSMGSIPRLWRIPLLLVCTIGVATTFSRGAEICLLLLIVLLAWRRQVRIWPLLAVAVVVVGFMVVRSGALVGFLEAEDVLNTENAARLHFTQDDSGRAFLAKKALEMFLDSPLWGKGLAATIDWQWDPENSSHNQFLNLAGDHGVLGLLAFPLLALALVLANRQALPFALTMLAAGIFSHNILDDRANLLLIALVGAREMLAGPAPDADETLAPEGGATATEA